MSNKDNGQEQFAKDWHECWSNTLTSIKALVSWAQAMDTLVTGDTEHGLCANILNELGLLPTSVSPRSERLWKIVRAALDGKAIAFRQGGMAGFTFLDGDLKEELEPIFDEANAKAMGALVKMGKMKPGVTKGRMLS